MNLQTDLDFPSENLNAQKREPKRARLSPKTWFVLCLVTLFVTLGVWSFTHQVAYAPPPADARSAVLRKIRALQVIPLDEEIVPRGGSAADWILGDGFSQAERDGAWMTALNASLNFSVDSWTKVPRSMTLTFIPLLGPTRPRRALTVSAVGASAQKTIVGIDSITIALNGELRQVINISCDSVDAANSLRVGPDFRPMCAKLVSLVVRST